MADVTKHHHVQQEVALNRPNYRESRWNRAVKVFTVNQESKYLLVMNVPSLGVVEELLALFRVYGEIEEYRILEEYPHEKFTDVFFLKYKQIDSARTAKRKLDNWYFFSRQLHVCYAPEFEMQQETREKLHQRRTFLGQKTSIAGLPHHVLPNGAGIVQVPPIGSPQDQLQRFRHALPPGLPPSLPPPPPHPSISSLMHPLLLSQHPRLPVLPGHGPMVPRPPFFIPAPSIPSNPPPFFPPELHNRIYHQANRAAMPNMLPPRSHVPLSPRHPVTCRPTNPRAEVKKVVPIQKPPPLISDRGLHRPQCPPPPLVSMPITKSPPPLISTASSNTRESLIVSSKNTNRLQSISSTKPKTASLSINDRIKMHLEQEGGEGGSGDSSTSSGGHHFNGITMTDKRTVICQKLPSNHQDPKITTLCKRESPCHQPVSSPQHLNTPHITTGRSSINSSNSNVVITFSPNHRNLKQVPVVSVQGQPQATLEGSRVTVDRNYTKDGSCTTISSDITTGSTSVDSTVSNIRNQMTKIFKPCSPELQEPSAKKRKRI